MVLTKQDRHWFTPMPLLQLWPMSGTHFEQLALKAKGDYISGPIRKSVLVRLPPPGHDTDSRLKYTLSLPVKKDLLTCPGASPWRAGFRFTTHLDSTNVLLVNKSQGCHLCTLPKPCYTSRSSYIYLKSRCLQLSQRGHVQITYFGGQQGLGMWSHRLYT